MIVLSFPSGPPSLPPSLRRSGSLWITNFAAILLFRQIVAERAPLANAFRFCCLGQVLFPF